MEIFEGKVALVTGASRGIGRAIAEQLAANRARVAVNYVSKAEAAEEVVAGIKARGGTAIAIKANITSGEEVDRMVAETVQALGGLHILVNNAGITRDKLIVRMTEEDWDTVLTTNVKGAFLCTRAALRVMMRQRWGRIVNIASIAWMIGNAGQANYTTAKSAIVGLTRSTAVEMASRGVTANAVAPGMVNTEMTAQLGDAWVAEGIKHIPVGRAAEPAEIARAVMFFASENAGYITGQVLNVDGGWTVSLT